ncbi:MAG: hypothetical protein IH840_13290, partial [Candidatus Heimdallarchaeota archaeon]|nr:hypothetical protein [Candidatus Heimdallarchaeota archaeon]
SHDRRTQKLGVGLGLAFVEKAVETLGGDAMIQGVSKEKENTGEFEFSITITLLKNIDETGLDDPEELS